MFSNRGPQFAARFMRALYKRLGIETGFTTTYHSQGNGKIERMNKEIKTFLRLFIDQRQDDWARLLPVAEFAINSRVQSALQHSPFEILYGYQPDFTIPVGGRSNMPEVDKRLDQLREARKDAEAALRRSKEEMAGDAKPPREFKVGDKVWLDADKVHIHQASQKLGPRQLGPYPIIEKLSNRDYWLKLPTALKIHNVFYVDCLAPWGGNKVNGKLPPPPASVVVDGEEEYEVDEILNSCLYRCQL